MKRILLSAFLAVMMVLTMAPAAFAAGEGDDTTGGSASGGTGSSEGTPAETLQAKIEVAAENGGTVTLDKDYTEDITIPAGKPVTLDLNGHKLTNKASHTIMVEQGATLTINGEGTVDNVTHAKSALVNYGEVVLNNGVTLERSSEKGILIPYSNGGNSYYTILNDKGATMTINNATVKNSGGYSSAIRNGGDSKCNDESHLTIKDGNFSGGLNAVKNDELGILTINGGTFSNSSQYVVMNWHKAVINAGTFSAKESSDAVLQTASYDPVRGVGKLEITGGIFNCTGEQDMIYPDFIDKNGKHYPGTASITGGVFGADVTKYCANGTMAAEQEDGTYKVIPIPDETITEVKATASTGNATANTDKITDETAKAAAVAAAKSAVPTVSEKDTAAKELTKEEKGDALNALLSNSDSGIKLDAEGKVVASDNSTTNVEITVTKVIYLDIAVNAYDSDKHTVTMDVTPKYNVVAKTSAMGDDAAPIVVSSANDLTVTEPTTVTLELDKSFFGNVTKPVAYVQHTKDNKVYVYDTKITESTDTAKYQVEFVTPHGFSPMTITTEAPAAKIGDVGYTSLTAAVASAANGDTIKLLANCDDEITISKNVTIECGEFKADKVTAGSGYTKTVSGTTITIAKKSSGSSGKTTYKVTTSAVNNGGVNASPSNAEKGDTITITLSPDKGYTLGKLTVTDGSGKTVSTVKKSDTVYTFTMPASAVNVGVSYVKADETPSKTGYSDVSANDWFASAVDYVTDNGMMNGTGTNTFGPKANTTRGMVVTVLYRLENEPSTAAASFTDVASGAYYANAVAWANANGIVSGYGNGKFGPNDKVTREQFAAILYRYAQYKKYDVSVGEDTNILSYDDAQSISSYAVSAIQWACGSGVLTGKTGNKLDPKGNATRAEVAAMLMRFCENVQ